MSKASETHQKLIAKQVAANSNMDKKNSALQQELGRELEWTDFCDTQEYLDWHKAFMAVENFEKELIRSTFKKARRAAPQAYISLLNTMKNLGVTLDDMMTPQYRADLFKWAMELAY